MTDELRLNVPLLRRRVPNLTAAARQVGLRPATVSNLCTGKIPIGGAEVRTLAALAALAGCTLDELVLRGEVATMIETGIKAVDLFAPLVRGGTAGFITRQGVGQLVLVGEVMRRLRERRQFATVLWLPTEPWSALDEVRPDATATADNTDEATALVQGARMERDVLLATDRQHVLDGSLLQLRERLQEAGSRPVTYALFDARGETPDAEGAPYGPLETVWRLDLDLAVRQLFPAVDPLQSTSVLLEGAHVEATHLALATRARALLRRYRELRTLAPVHGLAKFAPADQERYRRGERLEAFLSQPFFTAEPYTHRPGVWAPLAETLDGVRRILDGGADHLEVDALRFTGALPTVIA